MQQRIKPGLVALALVAALPAGAWAAGAVGGADAPVWLWPLGLFVFCLGLGVVAVVAGLGGGILYVPLVSAFFPVHLDFVRGAGLFVGLSSALGSGPELLRRDLASLRLAVPFALCSALGGVLGARGGLAAPRDVVETLLGVTVLAVAILMARGGLRERCLEGGPVALALGMVGSYEDLSAGQQVAWEARHARYGLPIAFVIGLLGGLFGVGGGWAVVPTFSLLMGVPLKVAAATSGLEISLGNLGALTVYLRQGSILPSVVVPSVLGLMIGSALGARLLQRANAPLVRRVMVVVLMAAGARSLLVGALHWWGRAT